MKKYMDGTKPFPRDHTKALQALIDAATELGGVTITFPARTYYTSESLTIPNSQGLITIKGLHVELSSHG